MSGDQTPRLSGSEGFLVITKTNQLAQGWGVDTPYKGVYNRVPWSSYQDSASGQIVDDPRFDGSYEDDHSGLISELAAARELVERLLAVWPRDELEIIFVRIWTSDAPTPVQPSLRLIGYDVAQRYGDFFSVCFNEDFNEKDGLDHFGALINEYRLFASPLDANAFLDEFLAKGLDQVPPVVSDLVIWETYLVEETAG